MSYSDILRANADMFSKARIMLEEDKKNTAYARGLNKNQVNELISSQLISDKIQRLISEKKQVLKELERDYNRNINIINDKKRNLKNSATLTSSQDREISRNTLKLTNLHNDIMTLRRQLETSENEFKKKSFIVFFLKNIFILLLVSVLVTLLIKNQNISMELGIKIHFGLVAILAVIVIYNLYMHRYKHSSIFTRQNWQLELDKPSGQSTDTPNNK